MSRSFEGPGCVQSLGGIGLNGRDRMELAASLSQGGHSVASDRAAAAMTVSVGHRRPLAVFCKVAARSGGRDRSGGGAADSRRGALVSRARRDARI